MDDQVPSTFKTPPVTTSRPIPKVNDETSSNLISTIGPYPCPAPEGFKWVPKWHLVPCTEIPVSSTSTPTNKETSFQELFIDKVKSCKPSAEKKRMNLDLRAKVLNIRPLILEKEESNLYALHLGTQSFYIKSAEESWKILLYFGHIPASIQRYFNFHLTSITSV